MLGGCSDMDQALSKLVEELTTSGEPQLNPEKMKELKKICKSSEEQLSRAYRLLMAQLSRGHAEVRLSAFQIVDQLFTRSHQFRVLVVSNFQEFLELTLGTDHEQPLPPPREAAQRLRQAATRAVQAWNGKYGAAYKKLALGYHFLRHGKQVDFEDVSARTLAERKREEAKQKRLDRIYRERCERAIREMEGEFSLHRGCRWADDAPEEGAPGVAGAARPGAEEPCCSRSLRACAPPPPPRTAGASGEDGEEDEEQEHSDSDSAHEDEDHEGFVRRHGLGSHKYTLDVELPSGGLRVLEDEDNRAVVQSARDALKLIRNKFLPAACSWVQLFTRAGVHGRHLEAAIDLKAELETALRRSGELDLEPEEGRSGEAATPADGDGDDDDDDDFIEVPEKEGYEACIPDHLWPECELERSPPAQGSQALKRTRRDEEARDPTCAAAQLHALHGRLPPPPSPRAPVGPEEARKLAEERARAPVVPFGVDLCYWGQEQPPAGKIHKCDSEHRFWKPSEVDVEVDSADVSEMLQSRYITFAGKFEPVQHRCRAPRPDGRLCERQDRLKCPFHGKIIPRDDAGWPLHPEDRAWEQRRRQEQQQAGRPDWQDPEFMRDVEAATGVDLGSSGSGGRGRGKRRQHRGLTDLKHQANTARARIAKKVFAKAAVQRVVTAMNQMDQKKHEKFANQFNYALN
ncbi:UV-stimulated scaffold protein A [Suricata suricatta]|uniref:UV-stimulated scaffold protein A n=1 Tax=Suricata suricatta TaxID=37032 RepID=UPI001155BB73|nr:UV-stimulated scaffold protein A [Suricata suricatta]